MTKRASTRARVLDGLQWGALLWLVLLTLRTSTSFWGQNDVGRLAGCALLLVGAGLWLGGAARLSALGVTLGAGIYALAAGLDASSYPMMSGAGSNAAWHMTFYVPCLLGLMPLAIPRQHRELPPKLVLSATVGLAVGAVVARDMAGELGLGELAPVMVVAALVPPALIMGVLAVKDPRWALATIPLVANHDSLELLRRLEMALRPYDAFVTLSAPIPWLTVSALVFSLVAWWLHGRVSRSS